MSSERKGGDFSGASSGILSYALETFWAGFSLAGFQVIPYGRIGVIPEGWPAFVSRYRCCALHATSAAQLPGNARCNSAGMAAEDESAARIPSADNTACAAGVLNPSADPLDFRDDLYDSRKGPGEVMTLRSSCPGGDTPLRGAANLRLQQINTLTQTLIFASTM